ncbi:MAG: mechanosensitive ion channel, partial [Chloroflexota bacterium]
FMAFPELSQAQIVELAISVGIILFTFIFGRWIISFILNKVVDRITHHTSSTLDDVIINTVKPPSFSILFVAAFQFALNRLDFLSEETVVQLSNVFFVFYTMVTFTILWRLTGNLIDWYVLELAPQTESKLDEQIMPFLQRVVYIILVIVTGIIILDHFNIEVSGLVATLGISSLAIAFAAQAALSDIISGFLIMIDRPYSIGDRIEILDLDTWGDVVDIGLRSTRVRTRDNRMVIVPNSVIGKSLVVNYSVPDSQYRNQIEMGVAYGTDIEQARQIIIEAVKGVEGVLVDQQVEALFLNFGDSALIFRVRWWLESYIDTRRMFDRVNSAIYKALNKAGIEMPFPQRDVHHKIDGADFNSISSLLKK